MSRKDYELIAAAFRETRAHVAADAHTLELLARTLADALKDDNANFNKARFIAACVSK